MTANDVNKEFAVAETHSKRMASKSDIMTTAEGNLSRPKEGSGALVKERLGSPESLKISTCDSSFKYEQEKRPLHGLKLASHDVLERAQLTGKIEMSQM